MQCTADLHHHVANPVFPHPDGLFEHVVAFDTAIDMFDAHAPLRDLPIVFFLLRRQLFPSRLLRRLAARPGAHKTQLLAVLLEHESSPTQVHCQRLRVASLLLAA